MKGIRQQMARVFRNVVHGGFVILSSMAPLCAVGCGDSGKPEMGQVRGMVTLNGAPLVSGSVISYPEMGRGAHGEIQQDGTFELETNDYGKGAVLGEHRLVVVAYEPNPEAATNPEAERELLVPARYTQPSSSGFSVMVEAGKEKQIDLQLTQ